MSIQFTFTIKPKKKLFRKSELDFPEAVEALRKLEKEEQIRLEVNTQDIKVTLCPGGYFWIKWKEIDQTLTGDCQTNVAGPGFHAAAIRLLERWAGSLNLKLLVEDDTDYFKHKNFERMRREHFYPWLKYILSLLCDQYTKTDFIICWDEESYSPKVIPQTVITPIRRFTFEEIRRFLEDGPEVFAKEFFVWNEELQDARFFRNSAFMEMSINCHFMLSERSIWDGAENVNCIRLLETALQYDSSLPFPKKEYRYLCRMNDQEPQDLEGVPEFQHECEIGYRRQEVVHRIGMFTYTVYGCCIEKYDAEKNSMLYFDDMPGHWHNIRITSFQTNGRKATISEEMFHRGNVEGVLKFAAGEAEAKLAVYKQVPMEKSPEGFYYEMTAQMVLDHQLLLVTQTFCRKDEATEVLNWFKRIEGKRRVR